MKGLPNLQKLFNSSAFKIPDYQRGYSWENTHRDDLLEDLELMRDKDHYTGTVVLKENGEIKALSGKYSIFDIVDGQQRFTSLVILLNCISKGLSTINNADAKEIAKNITKNYIKEKGRQGNTIYKLELDSDNNEYFRDHIIEGKMGVEQKIKSHINLQDAQKQFQDYLNNYKTENEEEYFNFLSDLFDKITTSLIFTKYEVEDDAEVGVIFEVMNDRGKPLSELEKVKNFLIYLTRRISSDQESDQLVNKINNSWKTILENLSLAGMSKNDDEDRFLRLNYIINFYSDLKTINKDTKKISINSQLADIHKQLKEYFKVFEKENQYEKCYAEIEEYVSSLTSMSSKLRDILYPTNNNAFSDIDSIIKGDLTVECSKIGRLNIQSNILVLIVSAYERFISEPEKLFNLIKASEILAFRLYYLWGYMSSKAQTKIYKLACDIYNERIDYNSILNLIYKLLEDYAPEESIENKLSDSLINYYDWKGLRYFLYEYEIYKCFKEINSYPEITWSHLSSMRKQETIEHILPQTIINDSGKKIEYWTQRFNNLEHSKNLNRLGNLTLSEVCNKIISNNGFDLKKKCYETNSKWHIEKELAKYDEWTVREIKSRENELIKFAKERWKLNYKPIENQVSLTSIKTANNLNEPWSEGEVKEYLKNSTDLQKIFLSILAQKGKSVNIKEIIKIMNNNPEIIDNYRKADGLTIAGIKSSLTLRMKKIGKENFIETFEKNGSVYYSFKNSYASLFLKFFNEDRANYLLEEVYNEYGISPHETLSLIGRNYMATSEEVKFFINKIPEISSKDIYLTINEIKNPNHLSRFVGEINDVTIYDKKGNIKSEPKDWIKFGKKWYDKREIK